MKATRTALTILLISIAGTLFSGFLSYSKMFLNTCAVDPGCVYFLGKPACYIGFAFFLSILILAIFHYYSRTLFFRSLTAGMNISFAFFALLFAVYITYIELKYPPCQGDCHYVLLMPSCFYGSIMFLLVFVLSNYEAVNIYKAHYLRQES